MTNIHSALRETRVLLLIFVIFCAWTVIGSYWLGFPDDTSEVTTVFGFPAWVAWCIALPWLLANFVAIWFALSFMKNDDVHSETHHDQ